MKNGKLMAVDKHLENKGKTGMAHLLKETGFQYYLKTEPRDQFLIFI